MLSKLKYQLFSIVLLLGLLNPLDISAQKENSNDSLSLGDHSVKRATLLSTAFPGLGQAYNKSYWKMPIVYGTMATTIYFAIDNHKEYKRYFDAFYVRIDKDATTTDEFEGIYNERQLIELQDLFRKYRDLNIILTGFAYALQIIDAHVDAHLFYYNVDDDLSLRWQPTLIQNPYYNSVGVSLKFNFK